MCWYRGPIYSIFILLSFLIHYMVRSYQRLQNRKLNLKVLFFFKLVISIIIQLSLTRFVILVVTENIF